MLDCLTTLAIKCFIIIIIGIELLYICCVPSFRQLILFSQMTDMTVYLTLFDHNGLGLFGLFILGNNLVRSSKKVYPVL